MSKNKTVIEIPTNNMIVSYEPKSALDMLRPVLMKLGKAPVQVEEFTDVMKMYAKQVAEDTLDRAATFEGNLSIIKTKIKLP